MSTRVSQSEPEPVNSSRNGLGIILESELEDFNILKNYEPSLENRIDSGDGPVEAVIPTV